MAPPLWALNQTPIYNNNKRRSKQMTVTRKIKSLLSVIKFNLKIDDILLIKHKCYVKTSTIDKNTISIKYL